MNIFYLDYDIIKNSEYHCDKHVYKMILEYTQMLCTAHRVLDGNLIETKQNGRKKKLYILPNDLDDKLYKACHVNHPCSKWVRDNDLHYLYLFQLANLLGYRFNKMRNKNHKTMEVLNYLETPPVNIQNKPFEYPPQCMPDLYKNDCVVKAYREYYIKDKYKFAKWSYNSVPEWFILGD